MFAFIVYKLFFLNIFNQQCYFQILSLYEHSILRYDYSNGAQILANLRDSSWSFQSLALYLHTHTRASLVHESYLQFTTSLRKLCATIVCSTLSIFPFELFFLRWRFFCRWFFLSYCLFSR